MSRSNRGKKGKLKAGVDELVGPLLQQLIEVEGDEDSTRRHVDVKKMRMLVEKTKCVLKRREIWDGKLIGYFEKIQRKIDSWKNNQEDSEHISSIKEESLNQESSSNNKESRELTWEVLMESLEELLEKQEVDPRNIECAPEASNLLQQTSKDSPQVDEPSNSSNQANNNSVELEECTKEFNPLQMDCLYSLGIFPENAKIKKRLLLYWWLGMGLVPQVENTDTKTEHLAETFFSSLVKKSILQPIHIRKHNQTVNWCTIKPTIHRHLISVYENTRLPTDMDREEGTLCFYRDKNSETRALLNIDKKYLNSEDITRNISSDMQVVQFGNWHCTDLELRSVIVETKSIDHIEVNETEFLKKLGEKVTFLSLRGISGIEELPESIGELGDLRILDLKACHNLEKLPQKSWSKSQKICRLLLQQQKWFKNLTYLDISECCLLDHIPRWVCELYELEVLKGFVASSVDKENQFCRLRDLSKLKKLRKLSVKIVKYLDVEDLSGLKHLDKLSVLTIIWGIKERFEGSNAVMQSSSLNNGKLAKARNQNKENGKNGVKVSEYGGEQISMATDNQRTYNVHGSFRTSGEEEIARENKVPAISFPKNLEKLDIRNYPKVEAPELLNPAKFPNLKRLYIRGGKLKKIGNSPGWIVEILRLRYLKYLDLNWYHLSSIFTKLKYVEYEHCFNLKWFPKERSYWDGPFPSAIDDPNPELLIDREVQVTITRNKTTPLTSHKQMMILELTGWDSISDRPGLDLVIVLDVSRNMNEYLLKEMKTATLFVIKKLSSIDSLSIVTFSDKATTINPLRQVTKTFQKDAKNLVTNLNADDSFPANIFDGLQTGLDNIKDHNNSIGRAASIMLLSASEVYRPGGAAVDIPVIDNVSVHTFGLWYNQDPKVLKDIADNSMGGTFSDVSSPENLTKAFSECLAGLLTVVVQDLTLTISPINEESTLEHVFVGRYPQSRDDADGSVTVRFGDLYSKEVRKMLVDLQLPATDNQRDSKVVKISCSYKTLEKKLEVEPAIVTVSRMAEVSAGQHQEQPKVIAEVHRREVVEMIREATLLTDNHQQENAWRKMMDALNILKNLVNKDAHKSFESMRTELQWLLRKMISGHEYVEVGRRAFVYSFLTSHDMQRTTVRGFSAETSLAFSTPTMEEFLKEADEFIQSNGGFTTQYQDEPGESIVEIERKMPIIV